jgi:hypothetical protein
MRKTFIVVLAVAAGVAFADPSRVPRGSTKQLTSAILTSLKAQEIPCPQGLSRDEAFESLCARVPLSVSAFQQAWLTAVQGRLSGSHHWIYSGGKLVTSYKLDPSFDWSEDLMVSYQPNESNTGGELQLVVRVPLKSQKP